MSGPQMSGRPEGPHSEREIADYIGMLSQIASGEDEDDAAFLGVCRDAERSALLATKLVRAVQILRHSARINVDVAFTFIATFAEEAHEALMEVDEEYQAIEGRIVALERAAGIGEDEDCCLGEGPRGWHAAHMEWSRVYDSLPVRFLFRCGEEAMARLLVEDPRRYERRVGAGWEQIACDDGGLRAALFPWSD